MSLDLVPDGPRLRRFRDNSGPALGISTAALAALPSLAERVAWARDHGFDGIEIAATGRPRDLYAPSVGRDERARLREAVAGFAQIAVEAPHQETYDVTLVSPSASIRRASVAEIWSCLRLAEALGGGTVVVRTGKAPTGVNADRQRAHVIECLQTLDRMAGDHNALLAVLSDDFFRGGERVDLLDMLRLRHTGVALDIGLLAHDGNGRAPTSPGDVADLVRALSDRLVHVRLSADADASVAAALAEAGFSGMACFAPGPDAVSPEQSARLAAVWKGTLAAHAAGTRSSSSNAAAG